MSHDDRKPSRETRGSVSPELKDVDLPWDDDGHLSALDVELSDDADAFDRVTAIPEIPNEVLARRLMARAEADAKAALGRERAPEKKTPPLRRLPQLTLEPEHELYEPDHDEPTVRLDQGDLKLTAQRLSLESSPSLSFEFVPASERAPASPSAEPSALPSDFPAALGVIESPFPRPEPRPAEPRPAEPRPEPRAAEPGRSLSQARPSQREPAIPRTRLPTQELVLDLDGPHAPMSALELAENAPAIERGLEAELEFEVPHTTETRSLTAPDPEQSEMKDRYAMGDFTGALVIAEGILESHPNHPDASICAERCRDVLTQMYAARLGPMSQTVAVAIPNDEIRWLSLDHRAGFLLSLVDGSLTLEEILDISGMSKLDALRLMYTLFDQRVITLA